MRHTLILLAPLLLWSCRTTPTATTSGVKDDVAIDAPAGCAPLSQLDWLRTFPQLRDNGALQVRVAVASPAGTPVGDILYLHGFADRADNHRPLFAAWTAAGFRVVAFDYPSHGETCGPANDLDRYDFTSLAALAKYVEGITVEDPSRPLLLAGWSTGGLLAERILQGSTIPKLSRALSGVILFAPGVSVYPLVGDHGRVTLATLTNNPDPPHYGEITPTTPLKKPLFAAALLTNSQLSWAESHPANLPTLVLVADDVADAYVKTPKVKEWVAAQRQVDGVTITAAQCAGSKHEMDNEPGDIGAAVRSMAADFATSVVGGRGRGAPVAAAPCTAF